MRSTWLSKCLAALLCVACGAPPDADAGPRPDGDLPDASASDAGATDAGPAPDAGLPVDAGPFDAGPPVDECAMGTDDCADGALCIDDPIGFHCACAAPRVGDGIDCVEPPVRSGIAMGLQHTCVIEGGAVRCFGDDRYGQLGDGGPTAPPGLFVDVALPAAAVDIGAGNTTSCAVLEDGTLWCWGRGILTGVAMTTTEVFAPTRVGDGTDWRQVAFGGAGAYVCGLRGADQLWCWGSQLAPFGVSRVEVAPRRVDAAVDWAQLHGLCGVTNDGRYECWEGDATGGVVDAAPGIEVARAGGCLTTPAGALYCERDPTGEGAGEAIGDYVRAGTRSDWIDVVVTEHDAARCALSSAGRVHCAGARFPREGSFVWDEPMVAPEPLMSLHTAGFVTFCGRGVSGRVHCWGKNFDGQAGRGTRGNQPLPFAVAGDERWSSASGSLFSTCATRQADGRVFCWGEHTAGAPPVIVATDEPRAQPDDGWSEVIYDGFTRYMIDDEGALYVVGTDLLGLGDGARTAFEPTRVGAETGWIALAIARGDHVCGVRSGELYCWGDDAPARVGDLTGWTAVAVDRRLTCALRAGELYCFGEALGFGAAPTRVGDPTLFTDVSLASGGTFSNSVCAVTSEGRILCLGDNNSGRRVPGGAGDLEALTPVDDATDWARVALGPTTTCGIKTDGTLHCWGVDPAALVDSGGSIERGVTRVGEATDWARVFLARRHLCGLHADGRLECWGEADNGAVGNGHCWVDGPTAIVAP